MQANTARRVKVEQGISLAMSYCDLPTLLTVVTTARVYYLAGVVRAYRRIAIDGVSQYQDLSDILDGRHPNNRRGHCLSHVRRLKLKLRGSPVRILQIPLDPSGMVCRGLARMQNYYGIRMLEQEYMFPPNLTTAVHTNAESTGGSSARGGDPTESDRARRNGGHVVSDVRANQELGHDSSLQEDPHVAVDTLRGQDQQAPQAQTVPHSISAETQHTPIDSASQQQQHDVQSPSDPPRIPFLPLPELFVNTLFLREALHKFTRAREKVLKRSSFEGDEGDDRLLISSKQIPFSQVRHLIISPFEFPATGLRQPPGPASPFTSVQHLELHVTSGILLSQVWVANLREYWQYAPNIEQLSLMFEEGSVFHSAHIRLTSLPPWQNLQSVHLHLRKSYSSIVGGVQWRFNEEMGRIWATRIVQQFIDALRSPVSQTPKFPMSRQKVPFGISHIRLYLPAESTFVWDPSEMLSAFDLAQENTDIGVAKKVNVTLVFADEPEGSHETLYPDV